MAVSVDFPCGYRRADGKGQPTIVGRKGKGGRRGLLYRCLKKKISYAGSSRRLSTGRIGR